MKKNSSILLDDKAEGTTEQINPSPSSAPSSRKRKKDKPPVIKNPKSLIRVSHITKIKQDIGIPSGYELAIPSPEDRFERPPQGYTTWYMDQFYAGLSFPIPPYFYSISRKYNIPLNQFHPNSIRAMVVFWIVLKWRGIKPTAERFYSCFTSRKYAPYTFYLSARRGIKLMGKAPNKVNVWDRFYLYVRPPTPFPFPQNMINQLPKQSNEYTLDRRMRRFINRLRPGYFHVKSMCADARLLKTFGLRWTPGLTDYDDIPMKMKSLFFGNESALEKLSTGRTEPVVPKHVAGADLVTMNNAPSTNGEDTDKMIITESTQRKRKIANVSTSSSKKHTTTPSAGIKFEKEEFSFTKCEDPLEIAEAMRQQSLPIDREMMKNVTMDQRWDQASYYLGKLHNIFATCPAQRTESLQEACARQKQELHTLRAKNESLEIEMDSAKERISCLEKELEDVKKELSEAKGKSEQSYNDGRFVGRLEFVHTARGNRFCEEFVQKLLERCWKSYLFFTKSLPIAKFYYTEGVRLSQVEINKAGLCLTLDKEKMAEGISEETPGWDGDETEKIDEPWWQPIWQEMAQKVCPKFK